MNDLAHRKFYSFFRRFCPARKLLFPVLLLLLATIALALTQARLIRNRADDAFAFAASETAEKNRVAFSREVLAARMNPYVSLIQRRNDIVAVAEFRGSVYAATGAGLVEINTDGDFIRRFNVPDGLPESDLTALAVFHGELLIGTKSSGLVAFDGERFSAFRLEKQNTANITALFADSQTLLVGTLQGGLLEFDGERFTELPFNEEPINHAIAFDRTGPQLLIGTFADGLFIRRGDGSWRRFTTADGLFSNRVAGVAVSQNDIFAATDLGLSRGRLDDSIETAAPFFDKLLAVPLLNDLMIARDELFLATAEGDLLALQIDHISKTPVRSPGGQTATRFGRFRERSLLFGRGGISGLTPASDELAPMRFYRPEEKELSDNNIAAISTDADGNIWLGTFRGGIDVVSSGGKPLFQIESDELRAINFLKRDGNEMLTGTAGGAFRIGRDLVPIKLRKDNSTVRKSTVNHIAVEKTVTAIASTTGLTVEKAGLIREFSTLNGLQSNSVFSTVIDADTIYAATMSGLAVIEDDRVRNVLTSSNSKLRNNWITALVQQNGRIFGGTYGGGVFELKGCCEVVPLTPSGEKITVNPNALFIDDARLYAGTLEGLAVFDFAGEKWSKIDDLLPSATVLAVTGDDEAIYLGTTAGAVRIDRRFWR